MTTSPQDPDSITSAKTLVLTRWPEVLGAEATAGTRLWLPSPGRPQGQNTQRDRHLLVPAKRAGDPDSPGAGEEAEISLSFSDNLPITHTAASEHPVIKEAH